MNLLLDRLPTTVSIGGAGWPIRTDFRTSIRFEILMQEGNENDAELVRQALALYYPTGIPTNWLAAVEKMLWFYSCGEEQKRQVKQQDTEDDSESESRPADMPYSFAHDGGYIFAAFQEVYGIDLTQERNLHWWKFRAMFSALPDTCQFMKIVGYRSTKITHKMSPEQKTFYRRMKSLYALPRSQEEQDNQNALIEALKNGGDLTGLI